MCELFLDNPVLQRMKGDNDQPPARSQYIHKVINRPRQLSEFVVDFDTDSLKRPLSRVRAFPAVLTPVPPP